MAVFMAPQCPLPCGLPCPCAQEARSNEAQASLIACEAALQGAQECCRALEQQAVCASDQASGAGRGRAGRVGPACLGPLSCAALCARVMIAQQAAGQPYSFSTRSILLNFNNTFSYWRRLPRCPSRWSGRSAARSMRSRRALQASRGWQRRRRSWRRCTPRQQLPLRLRRHSRRRRCAGMCACRRPLALRHAAWWPCTCPPGAHGAEMPVSAA